MNNDWEKWKLNLMKESLTWDSPHHLNGEDAARFIKMVIKTCPGDITVVFKETTEATQLNNDPVNHPAHYTQGAVECIDAIASALGPEGFIAFLRGQVVKYVGRCGLKGPAMEDIAKARWYLDRLLKFLEST